MKARDKVTIQSETESYEAEIILITTMFILTRIKIRNTIIEERFCRNRLCSVENLSHFRSARLVL